MELPEFITKASDMVTVRRVYGEPYERDGITFIPAAKVAGGGGGGGGADREGSSGTGGGFGMNASPAGAYVIKNGEVRWEPALDLNRVIFMGQVVAIVLLLTVRAFIKLRENR